MENIKNLPHKSGIYRVYNKLNGHSYIGQSVDIYKRFNSHHISDYKNKNSGCYNTKFYLALRKYGLEAFEIEVLELCSEKDLDKKEIYYISKYNSYHQGYNSTEGGQKWSSNIHSGETELKRKNTRELNQSLKGENHPRARLSNQEVISIRKRYIDGEKPESIFQDYRDRYSSIRVFKNIILGYTYKEVGNIPTQSQVRHTNAKLTEDQVKEIRTRYAKEKISFSKLGKEYGLSSSSISRIIKKETYKNVN